MEKFKSIDEILDFAIRNEEESNEFYLELAERAASGAMKKVFEDFAGEELQHKAKLQAMKTRGEAFVSSEQVSDMKLSDYLVEAAPKADMDYQEALIVAMKKEKAAFKLYSDLAAGVSDHAVQKTLLVLAHEEAKHKLRFEIEYDDHILQDN
ncbi:MAG: ferritin family protein [Planctomycetota bacterium]